MPLPILGNGVTAVKRVFGMCGESVRRRSVKGCEEECDSPWTCHKRGQTTLGGVDGYGVCHESCGTLTAQTRDGVGALRLIGLR